jgi:hypothetical protein
MTEKIDPEEVKYDEKNDICRAVKEFSAAMLDRMLEKYYEGFRGWDNKENEEKICSDMAGDVLSITEGMKLVDIANRAMMLWKFNKDKKC